MRNVEKAGSTSKKPKETFQWVLNAIGVSWSDLACSNAEEDREDEDDYEDTELGKLGKADEPRWVMGTISNTVQHHTESILAAADEA